MLHRHRVEQTIYESVSNRDAFCVAYLDFLSATRLGSNFDSGPHYGTYGSSQACIPEPSRPLVEISNITFQARILKMIR